MNWVSESFFRDRENILRACGNAEDEILTYIALTSLLSLDPSEARGWICKCHLCKNKFSARKSMLSLILPEVKPILPSCQRPEKASKKPSSQRKMKTSKKKAASPVIKIDGTYKNSTSDK